MNKGGNTSNTMIVEAEDHKMFIKQTPVDSFDTRTLSFQSNLRQVISGKFNINRYENIEVKPNGAQLNYNIQFEYIDEKQWAVNTESMELIGKSMAFIHTHCSRNKNQIALNIKSESYDSILDWAYELSEDRNIPFVKDSFNSRVEIFDEINDFNHSQPKIPLHRDFKPHNIIFDGENYHLIDFDFAAVDYVSIEVMSFVSDIIKTGLGNVKTFLKSYMEHIEIPGINFETFVDDYLNYLCTNRFPFYNYERMEPTNFKNLVDHRNESLKQMWENRTKLQTIIEDENIQR